MRYKVLILGGYGIFGQRIAICLSREPVIMTIIAGRRLAEAKRFAATIGASAVQIDMPLDLEKGLEKENPHLVINCCGPFQGGNYAEALACIRRGIHYIDLSDARDYVAGFGILNDEAVRHKVIAITGASTVPAISSAMLDYFLQTEFAEIHAIDYGVTPGNRTPRGVATVAAILSYVGKPLRTLIEGKMRLVHGWQSLHREPYPEIGMRWMSNCDIPDLDLFCKRYKSLHTIRFYAGLELSILHLGLWLLSWLARIGLIRNFQPCAKFFRTISLWFYRLGTRQGGMHIKMTGIDRSGRLKRMGWYLLASNGDGPHVPSVPSAILAKKIIGGQLNAPGAYAAMGLITREEILWELRNYAIQEIVL